MSAKWTIGLLCGMLLILPVNIVNANDDMRELLKALSAQIESLQKQVERSNARIDELEQQLNTNRQAQNEKPQLQAKPVQKSLPDTLAREPDPSQHAKNFVTAGESKNTFKLPGTETSIGIGGFVKLDSLFSTSSVGQDSFGNQRLEASTIPVAAMPAGNDDQITLHVKESRFWFKSFTPSRWGDINTYLEMDFYGNAGAYSYIPRIRHAYGSLGRLLAGQTWSTFLDNLAFADTLDNNNSVGAISPLRQPQLRWTQPFELNQLAMEWLLALEVPRTRVREFGNSAMTTVEVAHYPDLVTRINFYPSWGHVSLAALGRHLQFTPAAFNREQSAWTGAVSVAGKISTVGSDNIRFMLNYGDALGRYAVNNFFEDAVSNAAGELEPVVSYSGMLAYQHWWEQAWRSTLAYGVARADQPVYAGLANRETHSVHANLLWSPILQTTIGLEYIYANRELLNGMNGELHRVQFSTRFNF